MNTGKKQRLAGPIVVGIYCRISEDKDEETKDDPESLSAGVKRQEKDGRALCKTRGWTVYKVYIDDDLSAYKRNVYRAAFWQMLADLKAGIIQGIVCYDIDRFTRQPKELEAAIDLYEANPNLVFASVTNDLNLATADGRTFARMLVTMANKSSYDTSRRVARKHAEMAEQGKNAGSRFRPFGWLPDRYHLHPIEGPVARTICEKFLAGESLHGICVWLQANNIVHTGGSRWTTAALRAWLKNPRLAGWRRFRGEIVLVEGEPVKCCEPIVDAKEYGRIDTRLNAKAGDVVHVDFSRRHLCSGRLRCECTAKMFGSQSQWKGHERSFYRCPVATQGRHSCGKNTAPLHLVNELVSGAVLLHVKDKFRNEDVPAIGATWAGEGELATQYEQKAELMAAYRAKQLPGSVVFPEVSILEENIQSLLKQKAAWVKHDATAVNLDVMKLAIEHWDDPDYFDQKRAIVQSEILAIVIELPERKGQRFDPARLHVEWRATG